MVRILLISLLLLSCYSPSEREIHDTAVAMMEQDGIDPASADMEQWLYYYSYASDELSESNDPIKQILDISFQQAAEFYLLLKSLLALITKRGRRNIKNIFNAKTSLSSSVASLSSIFIGTDTPEEARNGPLYSRERAVPANY